MFKLVLEKAEEPETKLPTSAGSSKKQESSRKTSTFLLYWLHQSLWLCGSQQTMENASKDGNIRPAYWLLRNLQVKKQQLELDIEQRTGIKLGKGYIKAVYCYPVYLTCMQSTSCEMPSWMKHRIESRFPGEISITSDMQMTLPLWQKWRGTKKPLSWWKWKRRVKNLA